MQIDAGIDAPCRSAPARCPNRPWPAIRRCNASARSPAGRACARLPRSAADHAGRSPRSARRPRRRSPRPPDTRRRSRCSAGVLRSRVSIRSSAQRRLIAVGRVAASSAASRSIASDDGSCRKARHSPYAASGADQRRAAHLHGADGVRRLRHVGQAKDFQRPGQLGLVDDAHRPAIVRIDPDGSV